MMLGLVEDLKKKLLSMSRVRVLSGPEVPRRWNGTPMSVNFELVLEDGEKYNVRVLRVVPPSAKRT